MCSLYIRVYVCMKKNIHSLVKGIKVLYDKGSNVMLCGYAWFMCGLHQTIAKSKHWAYIHCDNGL